MFVMPLARPFPHVLRRPEVVLLLLLATAPVSAQSGESTGSSRTDSLWYSVGGQRHGLSFFERRRFDDVEYEATGLLTFDRYHTVEVMYEWLRRWAEQHPNLVDLYEVGESFEGRPILQVTLTNKHTGPHTEKPAAYFEGGRHAGEITSSESVLWLLQHLLREYGDDPDVTRLLNSKTIYLRPQNNPDGSSLYLNSAQSLRSSVRPHDSDRDGLLDEDPGEDLDGDGVIYQMRWRVRDGEKGNAMLDERDPSGRLLRRVPEGDGDWRVESEGIDNDRDGKFNEDGIGGLDLHRNYPENWRPEPGLDASERGYTQRGAGAYPLSEPETRTVVLWLLQHPHVSVVNSMDTRVPMHLRGPSTARSSEIMFAEDLAYFRRFDEMGRRITGYPWAGDVYDDYATRYETSPYSGEPTKPSPLFGHGPDFGYTYFGAIWYGDELWSGGAHEDLNGDGLLDQADALIWDDEQNASSGFRDWEPFEHPELGLVEIGGFHPKFFSQNGPARTLESWAARQGRFNLQLALQLPELRWSDIDVRQLSVRADTSLFRITASWTNTGGLPTALRQAQIVKIVQEDRAVLEFEKGLTSGDSARVWIVEPSLRDKTRYTGHLEPGETTSATFLVKTYGMGQLESTLRILSTRGGVLERKIILNPVAYIPPEPVPIHRRALRFLRAQINVLFGTNT